MAISMDAYGELAGESVPARVPHRRYVFSLLL